MRRLLFGSLVGVACVLPLAASATLSDRTLRALHALADRGSARAQFELADHLELGRGGRRDTRGALAYYCKAARQGHAEAAYRAGQMHLAGHGGVPASKETGQGWLRVAVWLGNERATRYVSHPRTAPTEPARCEPPRANGPRPQVPPAAIRAIVEKLAPAYALDPELVLAVIAVESGFRTDAVSPKRAMGLMQLIPETAARFGVDDPFDAEQNIRGGIRYLRWLLAYFDGDVRLALAGYNAGEGAVVQHRGVPPYRETQTYVVRVAAIYGRLRHPFDATVTASAGVATVTEEVTELTVPARPMAVRAAGGR